MRIVLPAAVLGVLALLTGCREPGTGRVLLVCEKLCPCVPLEEQGECQAECHIAIEPDEVSDDCFECFRESRSCFDVTEICLPICDDSDEPPPPEPIDAPFFVDAPF